MPESVNDREQIKKLMLHFVKAEKPATVQQLLDIMKLKYSISDEIMFEIIENEREIFFDQKKGRFLTLWDHFLSENATWFWVTILLSMVATIVAFIPSDFFLVVYLRYGLGILIISFLPGFACVKALHLERGENKSSSETTLKRTEQVALSIAISLVIAPLVCLFLNYSPWGITLVPLMLSLLGLTVIFSVIALIIQYYSLAHL
ncbi:MAG: DUF1616 domain-containing protein [Candidatus Bathyarchaeota archaeon]|nr:DUF1616 domain-containing protein [Candidatus Bathyarchaeota archaeon]